MVWCAELQSQNVKAMSAGDRLMDISAQGQAVLTSFDVYEEAGELCTKRWQQVIRPSVMLSRHQ